MAAVVRYTEEQIATERRNRIRLSVAALAYELYDDSIMSDNEYDQLAMSINPQMDTGNRELDEFFKDEFSTSTAMWIHWHPEQGMINRIYLKQWAGRDGKKVEDLTQYLTRHMTDTSPSKPPPRPAVKLASLDWMDAT